MEERLLQLLRLCVKYNGTDIHFDLKCDQLTIDMRIDGNFKRVKSNYGDEKLIKYLEYLAGIDVGNLLEPQTGSFEMIVDGKMLKLRFACIRGANYTNAVLRLLGEKKPAKECPTTVTSLEDATAHAGGLFVIAGDGDKGQHQVAYQLLNALKNKKIYTLENPIEIYDDNFIQLSINEELDFNFNTGVRQILRHDPDVIYIGNYVFNQDSAATIRGAVTTGHTVLISIYNASSKEDIKNRLINSFGINDEYIKEILFIEE